MIRKKTDFALPDLATLKEVRKSAMPARKGINPFTRPMFKAKLARNVVKAVPFKALRHMVK